MTASRISPFAVSLFVQASLVSANRPGFAVVNAGYKSFATEGGMPVVVGPQLTNPDGTLQENGRKSPFLYRKAQHFLGHESSASNYELRAASDETWRVSWLTGAVIGMKREVFDDLGGWDSGFFVYHEDSDLCIRARLRGYPVLLTGTTRWVHAWGRATRSWSWNSWKLELRSAARFYRKYPALLLHPALVRLRRGIQYSADDVARYHL